MTWLDVGDGEVEVGVEVEEISGGEVDGGSPVYQHNWGERGHVRIIGSVNLNSALSTQL